MFVESNPPLEDLIEMVTNGLSRHARFTTEMMPALYWAAERYQIDATGMIAQCALETNWGLYSGRVPWWTYNTAGLKVPNPNAVLQLLGSTDPDEALVHYQFRDFAHGAIGHAQHLRCYGKLGFADVIVDPRWDHVWGNFEIRHWVELDGRRWAGLDYGTSVESLAERIDPRHH